VTRRSWAILAGLALVQLLLVLGTFVAAPHPGGDSAGYVALADALRDGAGYTEVWDPGAPPHTKYPPVFASLLALAMAAGASGWAGLKVVPVLFSLLAVAGVYLWLREREGEGVAGVAALLTGGSAAVIYHAHWLLSDVPFLALVVLALAALDRLAGRTEGAERSGPEPAADPGAGNPGESAAVAVRAGVLPAVLAGALVAAALMTRTAGLPLAAAGVLALAVRRRWRDAAVVAGIVGFTGLWWVVRGRGAGPGEGRYGAEFFLRDPYDPELGRADVGDFVARVMENLGGYLTRHLPDALFGSTAGWSVAVTVVLVLIALAGWSGAIRRRPGPAELFLPLYAGLILLWPQVWSGDRFALPLVPVLLLFAWRALDGVGNRISAARPRTLPALLPALALSAAVGAGEFSGWLAARGEAAECRGATEVVGPWACGGGGLVDLVVAARWAGETLPPGSAVLTRKPRIWYAMSGVPTRTYPFSREPGVLLEEAETAGADYVLLDFVGGQGVEYVGAALASAPERYCQVGAFGGGGGLPATRLLRILPPGEPSGTQVGDGQLALAACAASPTGMVLGREGEAAPSAWRIPLLEQGARAASADAGRPGR
jgi:hypothetical protein